MFSGKVNQATVLLVLAFMLVVLAVTPCSAGDASFAIETDIGMLIGDATWTTDPRGDQPLYEADVHLENGREHLLFKVFYIDPEFKIIVDYGSLGSIYYSLDPYTEEVILEPFSNMPGDCRAFMSADIVLAVKQALLRARSDLEGRNHRNALAAAQVLLNSPLLTGLCGYGVETGWCNTFNDTWKSCKSCCESGDYIFGAACAGAVGSMGGGPRGSLLGWTICTGITNLMASRCVSQECTGKSGDPDCDDESSCEKNGGKCKWECGLLDDSGCGVCIESTDKCCVEK